MLSYMPISQDGSKGSAMRAAVDRYVSKTIHWVVFLGLAFATWQIGPVYAAALRFHLALSEACRTGATGRIPEHEIRNDILFRARQLDLPIRPYHIDLQVRPRLVSASVAYQVPVELGPRRVVLNFHATAAEAPLVVIEGGEESFRKLLD